MKKVAILLSSMQTGGIEKVSIEFMRRLTEYFDVTLFLRTNKGELLSDIPKEVQVKGLPKKTFKGELKRLLKRFRIFSFTYYLLKYIWASRIKKNFVLSSKISAKLIGEISNDEFDLAINYHGMHMSDISDVLYRIKAKKKIAFIHGDHDFHGDNIISSMNKEYNKFDKIFCVSLFTKNRFIKDFPLVETKTEVYYNPINTKEIIEKSKEDCEFQFDKNIINIVTVGRVSKEKGQDLIPPSAKLLKAKGYNFKWYIVGDGSDRERIENLVKENKVNFEVIFCGNQLNPYPFIKNSDIYVQPSYSEGYSLTLAEAGILGKVIIATKDCGIKEEIEDKKSGLIVEPKVITISAGIENIIVDKALKENLENKVKTIDFSHREEINKILGIM